MLNDYPGAEPEDELADLRAEIAKLRAALAHEREEREALPKLLVPTVAAQQAKWETVLSAHLEALKNAPELERMREEGILPHFAKLATRQRALEEGFQDLSKLGIETYSLVRDIMERLSK
jgi:hypothetical protein